MTLRLAKRRCSGRPLGNPGTAGSESSRKAGWSKSRPESITAILTPSPVAPARPPGGRSAPARTTCATPSSCNSSWRPRTTPRTPGREAIDAACSGVARTNTALSTFRTEPRISIPCASRAATTGSCVRATALASSSKLDAAARAGARRGLLARDIERRRPADGDCRTTVYRAGAASLAAPTGGPGNANSSVSARARTRAVAGGFQPAERSLTLH